MVENAYNGDGRRVIKTVNGASTYYLYEYDKVILETNVFGDVTGRNVYGLNLLIRTVGIDTFYYMYNGHADVTALLTPAGQVAASYYYDAFGNVLETTGNADNSILFAGYQYDKETGLYYLNARMYDPVTARFMQEDTYLGQKNDPLSLNLYTYCHNSPLMYWDPTGHSAEATFSGQKLGANAAADNMAQREMRKVLNKWNPIASSVGDAAKKAAAGSSNNGYSYSKRFETAELETTITEETKSETIIVSASEYQSWLQQATDMQGVEPVSCEWWWSYNPFGIYNVGISILDFVHDYSGPIDQSDRFKYNFIEPAIRDIRNAQEQGRENITWLISSTGYSEIDITNFEQTAEDFGVNIVFFSNADEFINYINTGDILREDGDRDTKVDYLSVFSHGAPGELWLGMHQKNDKELEVYLKDIKRIDPEAFTESSRTFFYSCGSASFDVLNDKGNFAQNWHERTGSVTVGFDGRTNYNPTTNLDEDARRDARKATGYDQKGDYVFPTEGYKYFSERIENLEDKITARLTYP